MKFEFTKEQDALRELVADICDQHSNPRAGYDSDALIDGTLWEALRATGITGIGASEEHEGGDGGAVELVVVAEQLGRAVGAVPFTEHAAAVDALQRMGDADQLKRHLVSVVRGDVIATIVAPEPAALRALAVQSHGNQWRMRGRLSVVPNAAAAE